MPQIYPIGGGKGGVGKSFISASLGALIASYGKKVALIDLDLGASNLHTFLGMPAPERGLDRFFDKSAQLLEKVVVSTHIENLAFISSCHCPMEIANLYYAQKIKLINSIKKLPYDYVFLDLGAGTNFNTLDFFLTAGKGIIVCTPEPTSIENAFRFIRAVYLRRLKQLIKQYPFDLRVKTAVLDKGSRVGSSLDVMDVVLKYDPEKEAFLKERVGRFQFKIVLNQFRKNTDPSLGEKIKIVCNRHFYSPFEILGKVVFDERVIDSITAKELFVQQYPTTTAAMGLQQIAELLTRSQQAPSVSEKAP
jgi:flagellar biosynthesis protein FlhG